MRRRVIAGLHAAGFTEVQPGHLAVLLWPGPDGRRPGELAQLADASKQAMNHLLGQLESDGYIRRDVDPADRRIRIVRLTDRGRAAREVIDKILADTEREWRRQLGDDLFEALREGLVELDRHFPPVTADNGDE